MSPRPVLALDVGGTQVRAAIVTDDGARTARTARRTPVAEGPEAILRTCTEALAAARDGRPGGMAGALEGIGISSPGPVDPWRGMVVETPNMGPAFRDVPLAEAMEGALGLPAFLDRDTNVAALGEMAFGAARGCRDFIYLTVSTGIGGAIVAGGHLLHGPDGTAGELGHMTVAMDGPVCGCGGVGHLEALASGTALSRRAREAVEHGESPYLERRAAEVGIDAVDAHDVADGELNGDAACRALLEIARRAFALACVGFVNALNPDRIVVGGSVAEAQGDRLLGPARAEVARSAFHTPRARVRIVPAQLGGDVGLAGAHPLVIARLADPAWRGGRPSPARPPAA